MAKTFSSLGLEQDICAALAERGIETAFPIQEMTIPDILAGRDVCGKARTGSGKTLAFGLPLVQLLDRAKPKRPTGIALVPTRELATQVRDELTAAAHARGVRIAAIYGGDPIEKQIKQLKDGVDFAVCTPGRAIDLIERGDLSVADVTKVVIDEADRMADMGFLPQVEWILRNVEGSHQTLLFSATLDGVVDTLVSRYQTEPARHEVESKGVSVEEMTHVFLHVHQRDKVKVAAAIIQGTERTMVFSATKHGADRLARELSEEGVDARAIHGDLRQNMRERSLSDFGKGKIRALVATDVAARGIHVDDVDVVIHFDPPQDHKTYVHRSGRTARAGESGVVVSLLLYNEELEVKRMQKRLGLDIAPIEVFSNDARLKDLSKFSGDS
ncbi:MAG: DEAD/DEAH box helicase [Microthrixaceae bacterium]|nr:DEAD/DEAH box helicase [Microthrixaceae bacterium]MCB9387763.1 DEAD/DEAH box helicase [Microthrixaceae bacterium]MCO5319777.1 DEAD/DEAH box helicase [Microthrixaceae bacterium]